MSAFRICVYSSQFPLSTLLITPNSCVLLPHRCSTTVPLETIPFIHLLFKTLSSTSLSFAADTKLQLSEFRQNFEFWGWKVPLLPRLLPFTFSPPCFFCYSFPIVFLCWTFTRLHFRGKSFCKKPGDHKIILKEVQVGSGTRFNGIFCSKLHGFCIFLWPVSLNGAEWKLVVKVV